MQNTDQVLIGSVTHTVNGLTLIDDPSKHLTVNDNTFPGTTWIGTPGQQPFKLSPNAQPYDFVNNPAYSGYVQLTGLSLCPWRQTITDDKITLNVDVPGLRAADLVLEVENGNLKVSGKRQDTGVAVIQTYFIGTDYDPKTAEACLEYGVLTVTIMKFKEKIAHRIVVAQK